MIDELEMRILKWEMESGIYGKRIEEEKKKREKFVERFKCFVEMLKREVIEFNSNKKIERFLIEKCNDGIYRIVGRFKGYIDFDKVVWKKVIVECYGEVVGVFIKDNYELGIVFSCDSGLIYDFGIFRGRYYVFKSKKLNEVDEKKDVNYIEEEVEKFVSEYNCNEYEVYELLKMNELGLMGYGEIINWMKERGLKFRDVYDLLSDSYKVVKEGERVNEKKKDDDEEDLLVSLMRKRKKDEKEVEEDKEKFFEMIKEKEEKRRKKLGIVYDYDYEFDRRLKRVCYVLKKRKKFCRVKKKEVIKNEN